MISVSNNHSSVDQQIADAVGFLANSDHGPDMGAADQLRTEFPEWDRLVWSGSWIDPEASNVDPEYMSWVADWIEAHSRITWSDGEPVIFEDGDETDEWL
jgi:hypothetical protein